MKFDFSKYATGKYAMHCLTQKQANIFCECFNKYQQKVYVVSSEHSRWANAGYWNMEREDSAYDVSTGAYSYVEDFEKEEYDILEFEDFDWYGYQTDPPKINPLINIRAEIYFRVKNTDEVGSIAYDGVKNLEALTDTFVQKRIKEFADMFEVEPEDVELISKAEYEKLAEED